jgi:replication initiation protein RepC
METHHPTTPFGRRTLRLAYVASQSVAKACPPEKIIHKWNVFRNICAAKEKLGVSDRALAVLNALLSFHPETTLSGSGLIVFPSNRQLGIRANGMAPATLGRHLAVLVDAGLVIRRDSPNGKRYARKNRAGEVESAFGFDLTPMVARAEEYEHLADEVRQDERRARLLRERITLCRRDIAKMIATGIEEGVQAKWEEIHLTYRSIIGRVKIDALAVADDLKLLADELFSLLENHAKTTNLRGNEPQIEQHIQTSNPEPIKEVEPILREGRGQTAVQAYPLGMVLKACPDVEDYARGGISSWRDLVVTVSTVVRPMLGISPSAWEAARDAMGEIPATITVAAMLQRAEAISSAGGYLRELTKRAGEGKFSVGPMLMALLNGKGAKGRKSA